MLGKIRRLIYKMGFCPEPGNIFYSPTLALNRANQYALKELFARMKPITDQAVYQRAMACPYCGGSLQKIVLPKPIKVCNMGHGDLSVSHNSEGLPVLIFEPKEY